MGNCISSSDKEVSEKRPQQTYKRTTKQQQQQQQQKKKPSTTGRPLNDTLTSSQQLDARKAAGEAAQKRLQEEKLKNSKGKLGSNLQKQRQQSTQLLMNAKLKEELSKRNENLVYD